jgi:LAGLIDADG endonuclease
MSKSHRLAWAAGFIDGDGFITIQNRTSVVNGKTYSGTYLRVGACQAKQDVLKELQSLFGGAIRIKNSGPNREGYNRKQQWVWTLSTKEASEALKQLLPFMIHKRDVVELALEFQETMSTSKQQLSPDTVNKRLQIQAEIVRINSLS